MDRIVKNLTIFENEREWESKVEKKKKKCRIVILVVREEIFLIRAGSQG